MDFHGTRLGHLFLICRANYSWENFRGPLKNCKNCESETLSIYTILMHVCAYVVQMLTASCRSLSALSTVVVSRPAMRLNSLSISLFFSLFSFYNTSTLLFAIKFTMCMFILTICLVFISFDWLYLACSSFKSSNLS